MSNWILFGIVLTLSAAPAAAKPNFQPGWVKQPIGKLRPNISFLKDYAALAPKLELMNFLMDPGSANEVRGQYEAATRAYEQRKVQGLSSLYDQRAYIDQISGLRQGITSRIWRHQRRRGRDEALRIVQAKEAQLPPLMVVGAIAYAVSDNPIQVDLHENTNFVARANLEESVGKIQLTSPLVNGNLEYSPRKEERYRFSLARDLPMTDITSSLSYLGTSNVFRAALQKPLSDRLVCVVDSSKAMNADTNWNESITFVYKFGF